MRTLSITLDDEAKKISIEGWDLFSFLELFGIAEHINVKARLFDIQAMKNAGYLDEKPEPHESAESSGEGGSE